MFKAILRMLSGQPLPSLLLLGLAFSPPFRYPASLVPRLTCLLSSFSGQAGILCSAACRCTGCKNNDHSMERKALFQLAQTTKGRALMSMNEDVIQG